ncbi:MAG TPA: transporter [Candidatus Brocadiia bacterium]|nr:transporter [Candidatus Brocadiia bacterium]
MRRAILLFCLAAVLALSAAAGETGEYVNGVEGIKGASVPPPGFYWRSYNVYYTADELKDGRGRDIDIDFDVTVLATVQRGIYVSDLTVLGGNLGGEVIVPLVHTDLDIGAMKFHDQHTRFGDMAAGPLVAWHFDRFDVAVGFDVYAPTGAASKRQPNAYPGKDMWSVMGTAGVTFYPDKEKTWSISVLPRYEEHLKKRRVDVRPGDDFHFEWGIAKNIAKVWEVGPVGYCAWQVTNDRGRDVTWDQSEHDRVYALGGEVSYMIVPIMLNVSARYLQEFEAVDRTEGQIFCLTLTKVF